MIDYKFAHILMTLPRLLLFASVFIICAESRLAALEKKEVTYKIFQFPTDKIPRIDGNADDWAMVPESYVVATDQLWDDSKKECAALVGWLALAAATAQTNPAPAIPHLEKRGAVTQLIVDAKPWLCLAGELLNNAASTAENARPVWANLAKANLNTVLVGVGWGSACAYRRTGNGSSTRRGIE